MDPPPTGVFLVLPVTSSPQVVIRVIATEMIKHQPEEEDEEGSKQCGGLWCHILLLLPFQSRTFVTWGQRQIQPVARFHTTRAAQFMHNLEFCGGRDISR